MEQLKKEILMHLKSMGNNENFPKTIRNQIPIFLLMEKTKASLENMKKAIQELVSENHISFITNEASTRIMKSINQNPPTREALIEKPTEDEMFVCGSIINISEISR